MSRTYTHPSVFAGIAAGAAWADPTADPAAIDWAARQAECPAAFEPGFELVDGRPVAPVRTAVRYGRNELGHWGPQLCADAIVIARSTGAHGGWPWLLLVERADGHGWSLPGGYVDPGENPAAAAVRELAEETGLRIDLTEHRHRVMPARYVPDPRASDEAWMVTVPVRIDIRGQHEVLPNVVGADDARRAVWVPAVDYDCVTSHLDEVYGGTVFGAHQRMLAAELG